MTEVRQFHTRYILTGEEKKIFDENFKGEKFSFSGNAMHFEFNSFKLALENLSYL